MDPEDRLKAIEEKLEILVQAFKRFEPLLERFAGGKIINFRKKV